MLLFFFTESSPVCWIMCDIYENGFRSKYIYNSFSLFTAMN
jgi:hypothetical protein